MNDVYIGEDRVERQPEALAETGGACLEVHLNVGELAKLDAQVASSVVGSRRAALKYLVGLLPAPWKKASA